MPHSGPLTHIRVNKVLVLRGPGQGVPHPLVLDIGWVPCMGCHQCVLGLLSLHTACLVESWLLCHSPGMPQCWTWILLDMQLLITKDMMLRVFTFGHPFVLLCDWPLLSTLSLSPLLQSLIHIHHWSFNQSWQ
jgi:hypothetical protein